MSRMPYDCTPIQGQRLPFAKSSIARGRKAFYARGCLECWTQNLAGPAGRLISRRHSNAKHDGRSSSRDYSSIDRPCSRLIAGRTGQEAETSSAPLEARGGTKAQQRDVGVQAALAVLWFYKNAISPLLPKSCRFLPTCSSYSVEAYQEFGFCKGSALTVWRVLRCNPFSKGGFDPPVWPPIGLEGLFS